MSDGFLIVDKPEGPTSHDLVALVRRGTGIRKVGHAGTLDPLASGVMVLAIGYATRLLEYFSGNDKRYRAEITLGIETDTIDREGQVLRQADVPNSITGDAVEAVLGSFRGEITQVPPQYSAVKIKGRPAYSHARKGRVVEIPSRQVTIHSITLLSYESPTIELEVHCSSGTYIRSLAHDIGEVIGTGAMLSSLRRLSSGPFTLEQAVSMATLHEAFHADSWQGLLLPPVACFPEWYRISLSEEEAAAIHHGIAVSQSSPTSGYGLAISSAGDFIAVMIGDPDAGVWRPKKVFS